MNEPTDIKQSSEPLNPAPAQPLTPSAPQPQPIKGAKLAFLILLIATAAAAALVSIIALLIGGFNDYIGKALLTVFIIFSHSLLILAIVTSLTTDALKRSIISSTVVITAGASMITSILGLWQIIPSQFAWHLAGLYFLVIGGAFIVTWLRRALIGRSASDGVVYGAIASTGVFIAALVPWVLTEAPSFPAIYYRSVGALLILITALIVIGTIIRQIILSHNPARKGTGFNFKISGTLITLLSIIGTVTAFVWLAGVVGFYESATIPAGGQSNDSSQMTEDDYTTQYNDPNSDYYYD